MICFEQSSGRSIGLALRLAIEGHDVRRSLRLCDRELARRPGTGLLPVITSEQAEGLVIPERPTWEERRTWLHKDLAQTWGLPAPVEDGIQLGWLAWYRDGHPLPYQFAVLADPTSGSGDTGPATRANSLVSFEGEPGGKAWQLTHHRLRKLTRVMGYSGPLILWLRIGDRPGCSGITWDLDDPAVHACLDLLDQHSVLPLAEEVWGQPLSFGLRFRPGWSAAIRVSVPPWPLPPEPSREIPVDVPLRRWAWPMDLWSPAHLDGTVLAGATGAVADVTAHSKATIQDAVGMALGRARKIGVAEAQWRSDSLVRARHWAKALVRRGYLMKRSTRGPTISHPKMNPTPSRQVTPNGVRG